MKNKLVPDPFYGLNNEAIIDIADSGREYYTFWFFTTFEYALVWHIVQYTLFELLCDYTTSCAVSGGTGTF